jgi:hypothetical protein
MYSLPYYSYAVGVAAKERDDTFCSTCYIRRTVALATRVSCCCFVLLLAVQVHSGIFSFLPIPDEHCAACAAGGWRTGFDEDFLCSCAAMNYARRLVLGAFVRCVRGAGEGANTMAVTAWITCLRLLARNFPVPLHAGRHARQPPCWLRVLCYLATPGAGVLQPAVPTLHAPAVTYAGVLYLPTLAFWKIFTAAWRGLRCAGRPCSSTTRLRVGAYYLPSSLCQDQDSSAAGRCVHRAERTLANAASWLLLAAAGCRIHRPGRALIGTAQARRR